MRSFASRVYNTFSPYRRGVALGIYCVTVVISYATAYLLRFELSWPAGYTEVFALTLPVLLLVRIGSAWGLKLTLSRWRYIGIRDVARLVLATVLGTVAFFALVQFITLSNSVPRSVIAIEWVLTTYMTAGLWISYRLAYEVLRRKDGAGDPSDEKRALIVGAGEAGSLIAREMLRTSAGYKPVGFLDDDPFKWGVRIHGLEVIGKVEDAAAVVPHLDADEIVIAIPSADPVELRQIVDQCEETGLPCKVLPGIAEVIRTGRVELSQLREVELEDLLGREPVELEIPELARELDGKTVLITGGAGSIGSELARQIALHGPGHLVLFDQSESDLYFLDLELRERFPGVEHTCIVGDVLDKPGLERLFREHRPDRIFHAAAYKHVPLMEVNVREAIRNNVIGTLNLAEVAGEFAVEELLLISTDKAANPSSVMGATKRVAELILKELRSVYPQTWMVAVRFGNVLGSRGSVIPLFKQQLAEGKPLTVTHPDIERYFMTIPEAVQLVLQASLLSDPRGLVLMLEMGEPIKIVDMARRLIRLSGLGDREEELIQFVGLRKGEKLSEELTGARERSEPSPVNKVRVLVDETPTSEVFLDQVKSLSWKIHRAGEADLLHCLSDLVPSAGLDSVGLSSVESHRVVGRT